MAAQRCLRWWAQCQTGTGEVLPCGHVPVRGLRESIKSPDRVPLVLRGEVRVPEDHGIGLVAEDRPDGIEWHPCLHLERRPRVAQIMEAESLEPRCRHGDPEWSADDRWGQRLSFGRAKDWTACDRSRKVLELGDESVTQGYRAVLAVLRVAEGDETFLQIQICPGQLDPFPAPSRGVKGSQDQEFEPCADLLQQGRCLICVEE